MPVGRRAVLAEYSSLSEAMAAFVGLPTPRPEGIIDVVPAARTILVSFAPHAAAADIIQWLHSAGTHAASEIQLRPIDIDVVYDGDDLDEVAMTLGLSPEEVVGIHTSLDYRVAFTGFAPGFAYLVAPDKRLHVPRRATPRPRVPAGAVGLAGEFSGVYPRATPGGWQLLGHTNAALWDSQREQPALLHPGDAVRFRAVRPSLTSASAPAIAAPSAPASAPTTPVPTAQPYHEVVGVTVNSPGLQLLIQDLGRPGHAAEGVTACGAADRAAHRAANEAVGNPPTAATLELAIGGAELAFAVDAVIALTGAHAPATIVTGDTEIDVVPGAPTAIAAGSTLSIGYATRGVRAYLAVRGGWEQPSTLRSRATDTLSGLGPEPLRAGSRLTISATQPRTAVTVVVPEPTPLASPDDTATIDVTFGPRDDWFTDEARHTLTAAAFTVSATSDRVGVRLDGTPLDREKTDELPSEGVVRGAIQVPANGLPVIFLADHPVTGGYPVIAVVVSEHLDRIAQLPAGTTVRFRVR
nr:5-oxoprolinase subunit PxpB [Microbacterium sp. NC79]